MKPKIVRIGRTFGLPHYSSAKIEWEAEVQEGETLMEATAKLLQEIEKYARDRGWIPENASI